MRTDETIHSFDDFICPRTDAAIMHYCLPFDGASCCTRHRARQGRLYVAAPAPQHAARTHRPSRFNNRASSTRERDGNTARIKQVVEEIIIIFTTSHSIQHLVTILRAHCGPTESGCKIFSLLARFTNCTFMSLRLCGLTFQ